MPKKNREQKIKELLKREPHLKYLEAMEVVLHGESKVDRKSSLGKKQSKKKRKSKSKSDAMFKVVSGGFETNKRKH